jgi:hypothetical protein
VSTDFTVEISQNEYLAEGAEDVNAIVTVTAPDSGVAAPVDDQGGAEIIIIDCSGSMRSPRTKIEQARAATAAAVDVIKDGVAFAVPDPSGLAGDFAAMMETAMGKQVADVSLRVWTPQHATFRFLKQVAPTVEDLTSRRVQSGPQAGDYPTGAWGAGESRGYHLCVRVTPAGVGQEMLAPWR